MNMNEFNDFLPIKFMIVMGKMHATVLGKTEKYIKELGLNTTEFLIMYAIGAHGRLTIQDIGARISMTSGNMTYTIDKLEKRDLILRERCPNDRRRIYINFTQEGQEKWIEIMDVHTRHMSDVFKDIDEKDLTEAIKYMKTIGKTLDEHANG